MNGGNNSDECRSQRNQAPYLRMKGIQQREMKKYNPKTQGNIRGRLPRAVLRHPRGEILAAVSCNHIDVADAIKELKHTENKAHWGWFVRQFTDENCSCLLWLGFCRVVTESYWSVLWPQLLGEASLVWESRQTSQQLTLRSLFFEGWDPGARQHLLEGKPWSKQSWDQSWKSPLWILIILTHVIR